MASEPATLIAMSVPEVAIAPSRAAGRVSRAVLWTVGAWSSFALLNASQVYLAMWDHGHSFLRLFAFHLCVWNFWGAFTPLFVRLARRFPPFSIRNALAHFGAALPISALHITVWLALTVAIRPYDAMTVNRFTPYLMESIASRLPFDLVVYAATIATITAFGISRRLRERELRTAQLESELSRARLLALQLQLQPHFLFNALHAVGSLVRTGENQKAVGTIAGLSDLLRYTLDTEGTVTVPFRKEMEAIARYLEIEGIRFGDRLRAEIDVEPAAEAVAIPPLLLQPLVENAVRHGVGRSADVLRVRVSARLEGERIRIEIFNTGTLESDARGRGLGLANARRRLEQLFPGAFELQLSSAPGGVVTRISFPADPEQSRA